MTRDWGLYVHNTMTFTSQVNNTPCKSLSLTGTEASMYTTLWLLTRDRGRYVHNTMTFTSRISNTPCKSLSLTVTEASMYTTLQLSLHVSIKHTAYIWYRDTASSVMLSCTILRLTCACSSQMNPVCSQLLTCTIPLMTRQSKHQKQHSIAAN